jgi:hypothetical protein
VPALPVFNQTNALGVARERAAPPPVRLIASWPAVHSPFTLVFPEPPASGENLTCRCSAYVDADCTIPSAAFAVQPAANATFVVPATGQAFNKTLFAAATAAAAGPSAAAYLCCSVTSSLATATQCSGRGRYLNPTLQFPLASLGSTFGEIQYALAESSAGRFRPFLVPAPFAGDVVLSATGLNACGGRLNTSCSDSAWYAQAWAAVAAGAQPLLPPLSPPLLSLLITDQPQHIVLATKSTTLYPAELFLVLGNGSEPVLPNWVVPFNASFAASSAVGALLSFTLPAFSTSLCGNPNSTSYYFCQLQLTLGYPASRAAVPPALLDFASSSASSSALLLNISKSYPASPRLAEAENTDFVAGYVGSGTAPGNAPGILLASVSPQQCPGGVCYSAQCSGFRPLADCLLINGTSGTAPTLTQWSAGGEVLRESASCAWGFTSICRNCSSDKLPVTPERPQFMYCGGGRTLYLNPGYWAPSVAASPDEVQECLPRHCTGSFTLEPATSTLNFSLAAPAPPNSCYQGYRGFTCNLCAPGYAPGLNGACDKCPEGLGAYGTLFASVGAVVGATLGLGAGLYRAALFAFYNIKVRAGDGGNAISLQELAQLLLRRSATTPP